MVTSDKREREIFMDFLCCDLYILKFIWRTSHLHSTWLMAGGGLVEVGHCKNGPPSSVGHVHVRQMHRMTTPTTTVKKTHILYVISKFSNNSQFVLKSVDVHYAIPIVLINCKLYTCYMNCVSTRSKCIN
jgi:hypothetical protein